MLAKWCEMPAIMSCLLGKNLHRIVPEYPTFINGERIERIRCMGQMKKSVSSERLKNTNEELKLSITQSGLSDYAADIGFLDEGEEAKPASRAKTAAAVPAKRKPQKAELDEDIMEMEHAQLCKAMNGVRTSWHFDVEMAPSTSHRLGFIGKICTFFRKLVRRVSRWMLVPLANRQTDFNRNAYDALLALERIVNELRIQQQAEPEESKLTQEDKEAWLELEEADNEESLPDEQQESCA